MSNKKILVSIGIPAFNEEKNIKKLLVSLLSQKEKGFKLDKIFVTNDQSTDNTKAEIISLKSKLIFLLDNKTRRGQAESQNTILKHFIKDIIIFLNADIKISDRYFISKIIQPIINNEEVGIVSSEIIPLPSSNLFERIINFSVNYKTSVYRSWKHGNNLFLCHGRARAFSKKFIGTFRWNNAVSEDAYSYLCAIKNGFQFIYNPVTQVYFRSPNNYKDHWKQSNRFFNSIKDLSKYLPRDLVIREYSLPKHILFYKSIEYLLKNPILFIGYILIILRVKISPRLEIDNKWEISPSSKNLE